MGWEEREARRQSRFERRNRRRGTNLSWLGGAVLVALGSILFVDNLGWVSADRIWSSFWPLAVIAFGVWRIVNPGRIGDRLLGGLAIAFGVLFLLAGLNVLHVRLHGGSWPLAILMIVSGIMALQKSLERSAGRGTDTPPMASHPPNWPIGSQQPLGSLNPVVGDPVYVDDWVFAGSKKRRVEATDFRGGEVHCFLGELILDLRNTRQPRRDRPMVLEAQCVMGTVRLRIPQDWTVQLEGSSVFGNFQDKTIPVQGLNGNSPILIVTGGAFFGEIVVDS